MNKKLLRQVFDYNRRGAVVWGKLPPELFFFRNRTDDMGQGGAYRG